MNTGPITGKNRVRSNRWVVDVGLVTCLVAAALSAGNAMAQCGSAQDLGTIAPSIFSGPSVSAVNDLNQVVGAAIFSRHGGLHAYLAQQGNSLQDLGTLVVGGGSVANDINNSSQVVGYSTTSVSGVIHAFLWSSGTMTDLTPNSPNGSSNALDINNKGQIAGYSSGRAVLWTNGVMQDLGVGGSAIAVNELGHVAITAGHAFFWTPTGGFVDLGTLGGTSSAAVAINDNDEVTGTSTIADGITTHGFHWANGVMTDLGTLSTCSGSNCTVPRAINSNGAVVGFSSTANGSTPFFWSSGCGGIHDLTGVSNPGQALAINGAGGIAGGSVVGGFSGANFWSVDSNCFMSQTSLNGVGGSNDNGVAIGVFSVVAGTSLDRGGAVHAVTWLGCGGIVTASGDFGISPGKIVSGSYLSTYLSDDGREGFQETKDNVRQYHLYQYWSFPGVVGTTHRLHLEGYRPNNSDGDNFQFYDCEGSISSCLGITGALINSSTETDAGADYSFTTSGSGPQTIYILMHDTGPGRSQNSVYVDQLLIKSP